jgi:hypothetical protein
VIDALYRSGVIAAVTLALGSGQAWVPGGAAGAGQPGYRARSGQSRQAAPKAALRLRVIGRVTPVGQVTDIGWSAVGDDDRELVDRQPALHGRAQWPGL